LVVEGQEVYFDDKEDITFSEAYVIDKEGIPVEPDDCIEKEDSTRAEGGVYKWKAVWKSVPKTSLAFKIICKRNDGVKLEKLHTPKSVTEMQLLTFDAILDAFGLSLL